MFRFVDYAYNKWYQELNYHLAMEDMELPAKMYVTCSRCHDEIENLLRSRNLVVNSDEDGILINIDVSWNDQGRVIFERHGENYPLPELYSDLCDHLGAQNFYLTIANYIESNA